MLSRIIGIRYYFYEFVVLPGLLKTINVHSIVKFFRIPSGVRYFVYLFFCVSRRVGRIYIIYVYIYVYIDIFI